MQASFTIKSSHPSLKGHFPGNPVVPGVVILDEIINIIKLAKPGFTVDAIPMVKFTQPLLPGQQVLVELVEKDKTSINFNCTHNETRLATGQLSLKSKQ